MAGFTTNSVAAANVAGLPFLVTFLVGGVLPNPLDIRFKKVSGLKATVSTTPVPEGGQNLYTQKLPVRIEYDNLVLERGMIVGSPLNIEFNAAMSLFKFSPSNVLVALLSEDKVPVSAWMFLNAYPGEVGNLRSRCRPEDDRNRHDGTRISAHADQSGSRTCR